MDLFLIDAIGPFFRGDTRRRINWSKIPFHRLENKSLEREIFWSGIRSDLDLFAGRISALGYNAVTLDDVAHLSLHPWLEKEILTQNAIRREEFRHLFTLIKTRGLRLYLTADFLTLSPAVELRLKGRIDAAVHWFAEVCGEVFDHFPEINGIILRIGESDSPDVPGLLRSRLFLRTSSETNQLLRGLLPVFESRNKTLIFRTWTVGAYLIGDLIWHQGRLAATLKNVDSPNLVVSMKQGESDFFRYLPVNRHFFRLDLPKILELQARREYEGAGEFPSFIGWDCEQYLRELDGVKNLVGLSVWCQTGGWHGFRRLAFLQPEAKWIELNSSAAIRIFRDRWSVEEVIGEFFGKERAAAALELLRLADVVVRQLLYIEEFARQKLFFRRVRIPPLLHVYWDSIFVQETVRKMLQHLVSDPESALREGEAAFGHFDRMLELARSADLAPEDIEFMRDTCAVLVLARCYYLMPETEAVVEEIRAAKKAYKLKWPKSKRPRYRIRLGVEEGKLNRRAFHWLLLLFTRRQRGYRPLLDRLFTLTVLSWIYRIFRSRHEKAIPKFMRKTAMGFDSLLR